MLCTHDNEWNYHLPLEKKQCIHIIIIANLHLFSFGDGLFFFAKWFSLFWFWLVLFCVYFIIFETRNKWVLCVSNHFAFHIFFFIISSGAVDKIATNHSFHYILSWSHCTNYIYSFGTVARLEYGNAKYRQVEQTENDLSENLDIKKQLT